ncbi:MAG: hypothetical protein H7A32_03155 [Deltaproteobacteria bacterium]|nr:hypothetical protein [Deltaproteobacteria bacterium]
MKTNTFKLNASALFKLGASLLLTFFIQNYCFAKVAAPTPPSTNPHPPTNSADKTRVDFATASVNLILTKNYEIKNLSTQETKTPNFANKDLSCLKNLNCLTKDKNFKNEIIQLHQTYGNIIQMKHAHIIPWSFKNFKENKVQSTQLENRLMPEAESPKALLAEAPIMKAPQLKPDEYMVHIYVQFDKTPYWHHLDVILNEDEQGNIFLRHFFVAPMMSSLPPGVVC